MKIYRLIIILVIVAAVAWVAKSAAIDAYIADDFVVTNSIANAKRTCLAENNPEACAYAEAPGFTRLKTMCATTLDSAVFSKVCPVGMIEGRDLGVDQAFAARKRP